VAEGQNLPFCVNLYCDPYSSVAVPCECVVWQSWLIACCCCYADYHFVSRDDMTRAIANNEFVEHAEFSGNLYGTR